MFRTPFLYFIYFCALQDPLIRLNAKLSHLDETIACQDEKINSLVENVKNLRVTVETMRTSNNQKIV